jgi:hypothetical protein
MFYLTPFTHIKAVRPNVMAAWWAGLLRVREIFDSNFGPNPGYSNWIYFGLSQSLQANYGIVPQIRP